LLVARFSSDVAPNERRVIPIDGMSPPGAGARPTHAERSFLTKRLAEDECFANMWPERTSSISQMASSHVPPVGQPAECHSQIRFLVDAESSPACAGSRRPARRSAAPADNR